MIQRIIDIKTDGLAAFVRQSRQLVMALEYQSITIALVDKEADHWMALEVIQFAEEDLENMTEFMSELKRISALMNFTGLDTYLYVRTPNALPIPNALLNDAKKIINLQFGLLPTEIVQTAKADSKITVAYKVQSKWINAFKTLFSTAKISSSLSLLIKQALASNEKSAVPIMQLVFSKDVAELTVVQNNRLLIAKCLRYKTVDDLAYNLLNICKQLDIAPAGTTMKVQGMVDEKSPMYDGLLKFFADVQLDEATGPVWGAASKTVPAHYFTSLTKAL